MKDIDQFVFYKLGHYLRLHPLWDDIPFDAKNLLQNIGKMVRGGSQQPKGQSFEEFWQSKLSQVQQSGKDFITPVASPDRTTSLLQQYVQEQEKVLLKQQDIFKAYPFFPLNVWQELVRSWHEEQDLGMGETSSFLTSGFFFPLGRGQTYQKLALTRREYKNKNTPSLRQLSFYLLDITEKLRILDEEVDRLYRSMDTLFWSYRRQKSNTHQLEGVGRELLQMSSSFQHAKNQLSENPTYLFLAYGFMSYVVYFENPQWVYKEEVEKTIMQWPEYTKEQLLSLLDEALLQSGPDRSKMATEQPQQESTQDGVER